MFDLCVSRSRCGINRTGAPGTHLSHYFDDLSPCATRDVFVVSGVARDRERREHLCRCSVRSGSAVGNGVATERWRRVAAGRVRHCSTRKSILSYSYVRWCFNNTIALTAESNTADNLCKALYPRPGLPYAGL